jgi:hypothetical protein
LLVLEEVGDRVSLEDVGEWVGVTLLEDVGEWVGVKVVEDEVGVDVGVLVEGDDVVAPEIELDVGLDVGVIVEFTLSAAVGEGVLVV